jgi:AraC-like DNA-binding protein
MARARASLAQESINLTHTDDSNGESLCIWRIRERIHLAHQYVITRRLERAKSLLSSRTLPLADIALTVGFQDQSQFTAVFKHHVGITPSTYARITSGLKVLSGCT